MTVCPIDSTHILLMGGCDDDDDTNKSDTFIWDTVEKTATKHQSEDALAFYNPSSLAYKESNESVVSLVDDGYEMLHMVRFR